MGVPHIYYDKCEYCGTVNQNCADCYICGKELKWYKERTPQEEGAKQQALAAEYAEQQKVPRRRLVPDRGCEPMPFDEYRPIRP